MSTHESRFIKNVLKDLMGRQGRNYAELAAALGVSLPTVRRILSKEDITLERLLAICAWLGVSLLDVANMARRWDVQPTLMSREQEAFFVRFPRFYTYLRYLGRGLSPQDIAARQGLSAKSTERYLTELSVLELIEVAADGRVRLLITWPAHWSFPGPLEEAFARRANTGVIDHLLAKATHAGEGPKNGSDYFFMTDSTMLPPDAYAECVREMGELFRKYNAISRLESKSRRDPHQPVTSVLLGIDHFDAMTAAMGDVTEL